jgi:hypothetical protein
VKSKSYHCHCMYMRRRPPNTMPESEYTPSNDPESGDFPSSFLPDRKKKPSLLPRNYVLRRRLNCLCILTAFVSVGLLFSVELARRHGHLLQGKEKQHSLFIADQRTLGKLSYGKLLLQQLMWFAMVVFPTNVEKDPSIASWSHFLPRVISWSSHIS